jgi:diguanylate cyclase
VTASVGAALTAPGARSADALLAEADAALLEAKRQGKARVHVFDERLGATVHARRSREAEVRAAATAGQFELHYQPIVGLRSGRLSAVEALVRWRHPVHGLVAPASFIHVAERLGVIDEIGRWVLRQACRDARGFTPGDGPPVRVSVNVSPSELVSERLSDDVAAVIADTGFDGRGLAFEITESGIIEDPDAALANLRRLKALGAVVALDDFGTGFSSLSQLAAIPVDVVKLDRSWVAGRAGDDPRNTAVVGAIQSMAGTLAMEVVAEGIERDDQQHRLLDLGCRIGQGFLFGPPVPIEQLRARLVERDGRLYVSDALRNGAPAGADAS